MPCHRCLNDPQPSNFLNPRQCAFNEDGSFNPDNWRCATIDLIEDSIRVNNYDDVYGDDESLQAYPFVFQFNDKFGNQDRSTQGFLVFTRYKSGGKVDSAIWAGCFYPPKMLTLEITEAFISQSKLEY